jgi:N utilization substance protein B
VTARTSVKPPRTESAATRHHAREVALQMLYQWEVGRMSMVDVVGSLPAAADRPERLTEALQAFVLRLAHGASSRVESIDPLISEAASGWRIERMNIIDRLILRLAVFEFLEERDTPATVIINEAIELARSFSSDESVAFVNGVLDAIRRRLERA